MLPSAWCEVLIRWTHVLVGLLWIGVLYAVEYGRTRAASSSGRERTARAVRWRAASSLRWVRWAATGTWLSGILLMGLVYSSTRDDLVRREVHFVSKYGLTVDFTLATYDRVVSPATGAIISVAAICGGALAYEAIWKVLRRRERVAAAASVALLCVGLWLLSRLFTERAVLTDAGALLGTIMAANAWVRIRPVERRIARGAAGGPAPLDPSLSAIADRRMTHNAYLAAPALLSMVAIHYPRLYGHADGWAAMAVVVVLGWALVQALHVRSSALTA